MGTKRVGHARLKAMISEMTRGTEIKSKASDKNGFQGDSGLIIGKHGSFGEEANPFAESSTQLFPLGTMLMYGDRIFRYGKLGGTAVTAGKLLQTAAAVTTHRDLACPTPSATVGGRAGDAFIQVTLGGTNAATLDQYAGGYVNLLDAAGEGQLLKIRSNAATAHSTAMSVKLHDKIATVTTSSTKADLIADPWNGLIVAPTTFTGPVIGVTVVDMTADYYGWFQVSGPSSVLYDENPTGANDELGGIMIRADAVAGAAMGPGADGGDADASHQVIGTLMVLNDDTEYAVLWLSLGSV
jgi:hypothetical protein